MIQELISMTLIAVMNLKKLIDKLSGNCSFNKSVGSLILRNVNAMLKEVWYLSNLLERSILWKTQDRNSNKAYGSRDLDDKNDSKVISATLVTVSTSETESLHDNIDNGRLQGPMAKSVEMVLRWKSETSWLL